MYLRRTAVSTNKHLRRTSTLHPLQDWTVPVLFSVKNKYEPFKRNTMAGLCLSSLLIFLWDEPPHPSPQYFYIFLFEEGGPLSVIMPPLEKRHLSERGFYFDNSLRAVWSNHGGQIFRNIFQRWRTALRVVFFFQISTSSKGSVGGFFNQGTCTQATYY